MKTFFIAYTMTTSNTIQVKADSAEEAQRLVYDELHQLAEAIDLPLGVDPPVVSNGFDITTKEEASVESSNFREGIPRRD